MKRFLICIFSIFLVGQAWGAATQMDVFFSLGDFTSTPQAVRQFALYPKSLYGTNQAGQIVTLDRVATNTGTSGTFVISNVICGGYYSVLQGTSATSTNYFNFTCGLTGLVNARDYMTVATNLPAGLVAYSQSQADGRFVHQAGGDNMTGPITNNVGYYGIFAGALTNQNAVVAQDGTIIGGTIKALTFIATSFAANVSSFWGNAAAVTNSGGFNFQGSLTNGNAAGASVDGMQLTSSNGAPIWSRNAGNNTNQNASLFASGNLSTSNIWNGSHAGTGQALTNAAPPPGWIWKNMTKPSKMISTWGRWNCSSGINAAQYIQWITNSVTQLMFYGIPQSGGIDAIRFEDVSTSSGPAWTRDGSGGLTFQNGFTVAMVTNMINNVHALSGGLMKVYGYEVTAATVTTPANCGNPTMTLATVERDIRTNIFLGFDGMILDENVSDLTSEAVRQGNRIANQTIFDYDENLLQSSVSNRAPFVLLRALGPNPTFPTVAANYATWENQYELNGVGYASYYLDYTFCSNVVYELNDILTYRWAIGPGHYVEFGGWLWDSTSINQNQNRTIWNAHIIAVGPMSIQGGGFAAQTSFPTTDGLVTYLYDLANPEINAIWNDSSAIPGWQFQPFNYVRPLGGYGSLTNFIALFNTNQFSVSNYTVSMSALGYSPAQYWSIRDPWSHTTYSNFQNTFTFTVNQTNGVGLLITPFWPLVSGLNATNSPLGATYPANSWVMTSTNGAGGSTNNVPTLSLWGNGPDGSQWANRIIVSSNNLGFDLNQVGGLIWRYDPENAKLQTSSSVSSLADTGPFGNNLATLAGGNPPWCSNSPSILNGRRYLHFSRTSNTGLSASTATYSQPITIFMVLTWPYDQVGASVVSSPNGNLSCFVIGDKNIYLNAGSQINGLIDTNQANWVIAAFTLNGASGLVETNGVTVVAGNDGANSINGVVFGNNGVASTPGSFNLAYAVGFTNMATANKVNVVNWLAARFGLANTNAPITTTVLATQTETNQVLATSLLTTLNANKASPISSNIVVSPYLWTNTLGYTAVVYVSGAGGGSNSIAQNGLFLGYMTNGCTLLVQPGEYVWNTNGAAHPNFSIKPF